MLTRQYKSGVLFLENNTGTKGSAVTQFALKATLKFQHGRQEA